MVNSPALEAYPCNVRCPTGERSGAVVLNTEKGVGILLRAIPLFQRTAEVEGCEVHVSTIDNSIC